MKLVKVVRTCNPKIVIALRKFAQAFILRQPPNGVTTLKNVDKVIHTKNFISVLTYHPSFIQRINHREIKIAFKTHIKKAIGLTKE